jgi:Protein of unknown function (DUF2795)
MERGNTKHGPAHDDQMARETEGMVRGSAQRSRGEEWRETEPVENAVPPRRAPGGHPRPESRDMELRSELARVLSRDFFPADRDELLGRLADTAAPPDLAERVALLPADHSYTSHDVLVALGVSSPESRG